MSEQRQVPPVGTASDGLPKGEIFEVLQNERRRYVLRYLRRYGGPVSLGDLATQVAAWEYEVPCEEISQTQRKRVYTTLQQTHLPKMDEVGIVSYDSDSGQIETTNHTEELTIYLEIVPGREFPWREFYLSLGMVSLAVVVVLWAQIPPFTWVPALVWATIFSVTFTAAAAYHTFLDRELTLTEYGTPDDDELE
ncbi:MAG: hypothetical protein ABEJ89_04725 [Haloarculaceae archaeon]